MILAVGLVALSATACTTSAEGQALRAARDACHHHDLGFIKFLDPETRGEGLADLRDAQRLGEDAADLDPTWEDLASEISLVVEEAEEVVSGGEGDAFFALSTVVTSACEQNVLPSR